MKAYIVSKDLSSYGDSDVTPFSPPQNIKSGGRCFQS